MPTFNLATLLNIAAMAAKWIATRVFITSIITLTLSVVLYNLWGEILETVMNMQSQALSEAGTASLTSIQFTGITAWMAVNLKIPESVTLIMSGLATRLILSFIKK